MQSHLGSLDWITSYGLMLMLALVTCWWLARRNAKKNGIEPSHIDLVLPLALLTGFLFVALRPDPRIQLIPLIITCLLVVFIYSRVARLEFGRLTDAFALPTIAAIAIQRIGCFLAGCCWGDPVSSDAFQWLGVAFPAGGFAHEEHVALGLIAPGAAASLPVHATQLYEAAFLLALLAAFPRRVAWWLAPGTLTLLAITGYALVRFGIEFLRADHVEFAGPFSIVQLVCVALVLVAGAMGRMNTNAWR
ncbi:MAG: hypothetical protein GWN47_03335 [Woeseiaceae bacterium]|nr:hypothetical protein [Woeseiaceae bacterium]